MLNSNTLNWNQVKADFGDTNTAIGTAIGGFSKAGDVFTKMRDRIAAEEQQALENEQWEKDYNEKVRQYEKDFAYKEKRDEVADDQWLKNYDEIVLHNRNTEKTERLNARSLAGIRGWQGRQIKQAIKHNEDVWNQNDINNRAANITQAVGYNAFNPTESAATTLKTIHDIGHDINVLKNMSNEEFKLSGYSKNYKTREDALSALNKEKRDYHFVYGAYRDLEAGGNISDTSIGRVTENLYRHLGGQGNAGEQNVFSTNTANGIKTEQNIADKGFLGLYTRQQDDANYINDGGLYEDIKSFKIEDSTQQENFEEDAKAYAYAKGISLKAAVQKLGFLVVDGKYDISDTKRVEIMRGAENLGISEDKGSGKGNGTDGNARIDLLKAIELANQQEQENPQGTFVGLGKQKEEAKKLGELFGVSDATPEEAQYAKQLLTMINSHSPEVAQEMLGRINEEVSAQAQNSLSGFLFGSAPNYLDPVGIQTTYNRNLINMTYDLINNARLSTDQLEILQKEIQDVLNNPFFRLDNINSTSFTDDIYHHPELLDVLYKYIKSTEGN